MDSALIEVRARVWKILFLGLWAAYGQAWSAHLALVLLAWAFPMIPIYAATNLWATLIRGVMQDSHGTAAAEVSQPLSLERQVHQHQFVVRSFSSHSCSPFGVRTSNREQPLAPPQPELQQFPVQQLLRRRLPRGARPPWQHLRQLQLWHWTALWGARLHSQVEEMTY